MNTRPSAIASSSGRAYTVRRLRLTQDGGSNWMAAEELEPLALLRVEYPGQGGGGTRAALQRVGFSAPELDSCSVRWRSGFPRIVEALVLSCGCWVHDGFQMLRGLSDAPALVNGTV